MTCSYFRRIIVELLEKVRLPLPGYVAFSLPLLRYIMDQASEITPRRHTITREEAAAVLGCDDIDALHNLKTCGYRMANFSVCAAVVYDAPRCLEYMAKAGFATLPVYPPKNMIVAASPFRWRMREAGLCACPHWPAITFWARSASQSPCIPNSMQNTAGQLASARF